MDAATSAESACSPWSTTTAPTRASERRAKCAAMQASASESGPPLHATSTRGFSVSAPCCDAVESRRARPVPLMVPSPSRFVSARASSRRAVPTAGCSRPCRPCCMCCPSLLYMPLRQNLFANSFGLCGRCSSELRIIKHAGILRCRAVLSHNLPWDYSVISPCSTMSATSDPSSNTRLIQASGL